MSALQVFIASSTEGFSTAQALRNALQQELGTAAAVDLWSHKFEYGDTTIESLEKISNEADVAIVLLTPDDKTTSRQSEKASPRDNLVFELGLFIGTLGRERTVVAKPADAKAAQLKLPSDILAITALEFAPDTPQAPQALKTSLQANCPQLAAHILGLGSRPKWTALQRESQRRKAEFIRDISGSWWERIETAKGTRLSFVTIGQDQRGDQAVIDGQSYTSDGNPSAIWKSEMLRCYPEDSRLSYLWRGRHPLLEQSHLKYHGYGRIEFRSAAGAAGRLVTASGDFWDVDEADSTRTANVSVSMRRTSEHDAERMTAGKGSEISAIVVKRLKDW